MTKLLETLEYLREALDNRFCVEAVCDYQKEFDQVPHKRLILKFKRHGILGVVADSIEDFLNGRKMKVAVYGVTSNWCHVDCGVPQGSVLGPLLFLICVNDIPGHVKCLLKIFDNNTKIWNKTVEQNYCTALQTDLDSIQEWSHKWLLKFNTAKCKIMHMGRNNQEYDYLMVEGENRTHQMVEME